MPCPNGIDIPGVLVILNRGVMYDSMDQPRRNYPDMPEAQGASSCVQCRAREPLCPRNIPIREWMPIVHSVLGESESYDPRMCPVLQDGVFANQSRA